MKYDFDLDLESRNSLSLISSRIKPNSTILEFGCANGRMSKYLQEALQCKVYAVELDEEAAKDAEEYCEQILKTAEQIVSLVGQINVFISTKEVPLTIERLEIKNICRGF